MNIQTNYFKCYNQNLVYILRKKMRFYHSFMFQYISSVETSLKHSFEKISIITYRGRHQVKDFNTDATISEVLRSMVEVV